ncbi:MAG TPA: PKD domain-containing protein, partial [Tenuifilaceae bacterium]|nr:PKD domain-containing protein [Tenuifilaceae bacterium]
FDISGTTPGVEWTSLGGHRYQIDPKLISTGNHIVTYSYTENDKTFTVTDNFDIVRISNPVDFNVLKLAYCSNDAEVLLIAENNYPEAVKGHFSGPISGFNSATNSSLATLTPTAAPKDQDFSISYFFETKEGCISPTITKPSMVNSVPSVSFTLRDNYNFDETPIVLTGDPAGGNFFGEIIELNKTLKPSLINQSRIGQNIDITYSFTNTTTGCVGSSVVQTKVYKADAPINNLSSVYCYDDINFNITCDPGVGSDFTFSSKKNALTQINDHTAQYSLALAGEGVDTVWYRYKINSTPYEIAKAVFVDSIGNIDFEIDPKYCNDDDPIIIIGQHRVMNGTNDYSYTGALGAFQSNAIYASLSPKLENPGSYNLNYKFTSEKGCYKEITKGIQINPVSVATFEVIGTCPNINEGIQFVNNSNEPAGDAVTWKWTFEDNVSTEKNPIYAFKTAGLKTVVLTATTETGQCETVASLPVTIGYSANADFKWDRECFTGDSILFSDNSSGGAVVSSLWRDELGDTLSNKFSFKHKFPGIGTYSIELLIETAEGCKDSITKEIAIQKFIDFNSSKVYLDNFEGATQDWIAKGLADSDYSSWTYGTPSGTYFNSAASGITSWYTNTGLANQIKESSQVLSPCFDLRGLEKPMVKLNIWSAPENGRDGAVLQYSIDGGKTWLNSAIVGAANEGINWYDPVNVSSKPLGQSAGWSGSNPQEGWKSARHNLDIIKDSSNVRFRIVYANDAINISPFNGFAFDDFWIGERQQMVLTEAFTNVDNQFDAVNLFLKDFEKQKQKDIVSIHYHTSIPVDDPFYNYYSAGTMSRGFYYGAANAPYVYSNGKNPSSISTSETIKEYIRVVDEKTLVDPILNITQITGNVGNIRVDLTANRDIDGENLVLYCALVKDSIISNGGEYFYNVLRKFYPSPSGVPLSTANWLSGQTRNQDISISFDNSAEIIDAKLVLFVQNTSTNAIYQTAVYSDLQTVLSIKPIDISKNVDLFPNPASDNVIVQCAERIDRIAIFDITGRIIDEYTPGQEQYSLPLQGYKNGVYLVKGFTKNGQFVKKLVKH